MFSLGSTSLALRNNPARADGLTAPVTFLFLLLPYGVSNGVISITLPFVLTRAGFSVATAASIVAIGVSANIWQFLGGPIVDLTLTRKRWYLIGLGACAGTLLLLGIFPLRQETVGILTAMVFVSQVAATFVILPVGGLMAYTVADEAKGRASGFYQAGNLGGAGLGGGAGVWLVSHFSFGIAAAVLSAAMLLAAIALIFVPDIGNVSAERLSDRLRLIGSDLREMRSRSSPSRSSLLRLGRAAQTTFGRLSRRIGRPGQIPSR